MEMDKFFSEFGVDLDYKTLGECHIGAIENLFESNNALPNNFIEHGEEVQNIKFYPLGGCRLLLILKHPASLYFRGLLGIKCLAGKADIDGLLLKPDSPHSCCAYSLSSHSASCISSVDGDFYASEELIKALHDMCVNGITINEFTNGPSCLLLLWKEDFFGLLKLNNELLSILNPKRWSYSGSGNFSEFEEFVNCVFDLPLGNRIAKKIHYSKKMRDFSHKLLTFEAPRLAVCGGKGVGKSTSLRFLVNQMLSKWNKILFVDFDIGQPEFTVPGCVSVHLITKPLLGPNYTHLNSPLKSIFLGFVSPDMCFNNYRRAIKLIKNCCNELFVSASIPCVINTMGYVKGCGLLLINDIFTSFGLTHVVELRSTTEPKLNFSHPPTPLFFMENVNDCPSLSYTLEIFQQATSNQKSTISAKVSRELMALFYLVSSPTLSVQKILLQNGASSGKLFVSLVENNNVPQRGEMVAVCSSDSTSDLKNCIGFGNVLSYSDNFLVLLTPLSGRDLDDCTIVKGDLSLSNDFFYENLPQFESSPINKVEILLTSGVKSVCPSLFTL